ncbi:hypothetical protein IG631_02678 [Alternaria alternata]|nr:hypothetical protein IG631_02678 [Alternaria alternata]
MPSMSAWWFCMNIRASMRDVRTEICHAATSRNSSNGRDCSKYRIDDGVTVRRSNVLPRHA